MAPALQTIGITKQFPGVLANDHIDFSLEQGEIHALLGENGAGKSTLMNILYGLYTPDSGALLVNGKDVQLHSPNDAIALGIGMAVASPAKKSSPVARVAPPPAAPVEPLPPPKIYLFRGAMGPFFSTGVRRRPAIRSSSCWSRPQSW